MSSPRIEYRRTRTSILCDLCRRIMRQHIFIYGAGEVCLRCARRIGNAVPASSQSEVIE